jgi:lipopolysaccharide/colanic/teichoic acid biosynthesis glycosyltransferase
MSPWLRLRVRLDRAVAAVLLVPVAPVLLVLAALVRRDGGPAFVRVPRVGRSGREFGLLKVRTMHASGPGGLAAGSTIAAGEVDDRITPVGRRLRRWRLDELANLVNVVRGEMSLLGPRPEAPDYVDLADSDWRAVLAAPPALAGPTQVLVEAWEAERLAAVGAGAYRDEILPVKLAVDRWYVEHATPRLDLAVVAALAGWTTGRSAGRLRRRVERDVPVVAAIPAGASRG